jgi:flagellar biosynthesis protein FlhG
MLARNEVIFLANSFIQPGDTLSLKVISPLYRDLYQTEVLAVEKNSIMISMPMSEGKMILLGVGTPLEITAGNALFPFNSEVISRGFHPHPHLFVSMPHFLTDNKKPRPRVITITSGKGGVGKTTFTINLGITLAQMGRRVFIIDADLGTANVDVLLNLQPRYNLHHVVNREKEMLEIVTEGPGGIFLVPGGSGLQGLADMKEWQFNRLLSSLETLEQYADLILIDTGAGLGKNVLHFALAADNIIIITTPEPHSITDAYAMIKVLDEHRCQSAPFLVLNRVESVREYQEVSAKMLQVVNRFLSLHISCLGYLPEDTAIPKANRKMRPFVLQYPQTPAVSCMQDLATRLLHPELGESPARSESGFFAKVRHFFNR